MKRSRIIALVAVALFVGLLLMTVRSAQPKSHHEYEPHDPFRGVAYYKQPTTGKLALYFSYGLLPNRRYRFEVTSDGANFRPLTIRDTTGSTETIYESFSVDPCGGLWPRVLDLGPSAP